MANALIKIIEMSRKQNIADDLEKEQLIKIGRDAVRLAKADDDSRDEWKKRSKDAMDLALQATEEKTFPWPGASNVKYPTITISALAFHARTMPAILSGNRIAKAKVTGEDKDGAKEKQAQRVADYLNYQILHEMDGWEEGMDKLLLALPIEGCEFKKTYFSPDKGTNVSEWIRPEDLIVDYKTKTFAECQRVTHRFWLHPQTIVERMRMGIWADDYTALNISVNETEDEELQEFYEQHCLLDLDEDGYKEPWCVTVHVKSGTVVRIKADFAPEDIAVKVKTKVMAIAELPEEDKGKAKIAKIDKINYFTKYSFIPSPDGGFYDIGLGQIVGPINDSISNIINQMIDAATWQNLAGNSGFVVDGVNIRNQRGKVEATMGEYKKIKLPAGMTDIRQAMMNLPAAGPSQALFNLLGTLIGASKDIAGIQDIHTGSTERNETATTTMIRVEEGQKVFNAIYKRIYRSLGKEIKQIYDLNAIYLEPQTYFNVLDTNEQGVVTLSDFRNDGTDVQPMADPSMSNTAQKVAKAEALMQQAQNPHVNSEVVTRRYLEAIDIANIDEIMVKQEDMPPPPPDPKMKELELKMQQLALDAQKMKNEDINDDKRVLIEQFREEISAFKAETERVKTEGEISAKLAAGSAESLAVLQRMLEDLDDMDSTLEEAEEETIEQGEVEGMEQPEMPGEEMQQEAPQDMPMQPEMMQEPSMEQEGMMEEQPIIPMEGQNDQTL